MDLNELFSTQGDYIVFAIAAVGAMLALAFSLPRYSTGARVSRIVWAIFLIVLAGGWWSAWRAAEHARAESMAQVSALAPTYAYEMESMGHYLLPSDASPDDPIYLALIEAEIQWQQINPVAHDIYTMRKRADGSNILIVDSETDYNRDGRFDGEAESRTPVGTVYDSEDEGLERAFQGEANFNPEPITDEWGSWVSAFVPMRDPEGNVEAVLGVDFNAASWLKAIATARRTVIGVTALLLVIVAGLGTAIALLRADVARRIQVEERLRQSEERMKLTIHQMPLAFIEWNTEREVMTWNPAATRIFGYANDEVLGRCVSPMIVPAAANEHVDRVWSDILENAGGHHSVNDNITKQGRVITCEWFNTPLIDNAGRVAGVISVVQDISERVKMQKHLQQSDRLTAVGQLAAGVAHDFNNILTVITGHTGLLLAQNTLPANAQSDIRRIESAAMRAATLTRQLLAFSRKQAMFPRPVRLTTVIESATSMLSRLLGPDLKLNVHVAPNVPPVEADAAMMEQVVTNLILNARDAISGAGNITLSLDTAAIPEETVAQNPDARPGQNVCLSIADTGSGIAPEHLSRIFEPFFTTKPKGRGTGLGLAVVHGIVQQHQGWITVDSAVGKGTTFRIFLPPTNRDVPGEKTADQNTATEPAATRTDGRPKTILLAEDEQMVRELAKKTLEDAGYRVIEAVDGHHALKLWWQNRDKVDLLFTDMVMPNGMTGRELSLEILKDRPGLPVVYASGYSIELTLPDFKESAHLLFIPKPYLSEQLVSTIRRCIEKPQD